ncbi:prostatic acid phosphatase [Halyomorpha halys]|uniref:prostatic acid phosphatase n=1 Tax=Halyomorpha halys TaxID=286706 RepID=UPI0006D50DD5|nr:prostatic acid phosphatase-like [Halyomorpha halys]XP_024216645.1 prostatic acid phosphatase-like [Halyomorpha halys]
MFCPGPVVNMFPGPPDMEDSPLIDDGTIRQRGLQRGSSDRGSQSQVVEDALRSELELDRMARRSLFAWLMLIVFFVSIITVLSFTDKHMAEPSLRKVYVVFRHGSRAPGFTYKNDPYNKDNEKYWPHGAGELTAFGRIEAYDVGKRLRERYGAFVGDNYKAKEFRAYTTLIERTMMSAQLVLASFFPPTGYQEWNNQLNWQPVPVYPEEIVNATSGCSCPRFALEFKNNVKNLVPSDFGFETEVGKILKEHSGEPDASPVSLFTRVWDTVYFQDRANLPIPDWLKPIYPEKMAKSAVRYLKLYLAGSRIQELLVQDPFGRAITKFFTESPRKMELHSLHDIHIMSHFMLLDIEYNSFPKPGSAIAIELHEKNGGEYIEVYYWPTPNEKFPIQMKMPCGMSCHISELIDRFKNFEVENYDELCNDGDGSVPSHVLEFKLNI